MREFAVLMPLSAAAVSGDGPNAGTGSSVDLLVAVLLGIGIPTAFIRPAMLEDPSLWPFRERWRHYWAIGYLAVVCVLVGFAVQVITSTEAFEAPDPRLQDTLALGALLLSFVAVWVHVLPLATPGIAWLA